MRPYAPDGWLYQLRDHRRSPAVNSEFAAIPWLLRDLPNRPGSRYIGCDATADVVAACAALPALSCKVLDPIVEEASR